jgi:hypothetical protein
MTRVLVVAQEAHFADVGRYASTPGSLHLEPDVGVEIVITRANERGWSAVLSHPGAPGRGCAVWVGKVLSVPVTPAGRIPTRQAEAVCDMPTDAPADVPAARRAAGAAEGASR